MGIKHLTLVGLACLLIFSSCSLQKRLYIKGFYVSKSHSLKKHEQKTGTDTLPFALNSIKQIKTKTVPSILSAEILNKKGEIKNTSSFIPKFKLVVDGCDTLFLRNGAQILVKVTEVYPEQIKYKYCDSPNEVLRTINKTDINYIVYANGFKEVVAIQQQSNAQSYNNYKQHKGRVPAIVGLVFFLLSILLIALLFIPSVNLAFFLVDIFFAIIFFIVGIVLLFIALAASVST